MRKQCLEVTGEEARFWQLRAQMPAGPIVCFVYQGFPRAGKLFYFLTLIRCLGSVQGCPHHELWSFEREWHPSSGWAALKIDPPCKFYSFKFDLMSGSVIHVQLYVISLLGFTNKRVHKLEGSAFHSVVRRGLGSSTQIMHGLTWKDWDRLRNLAGFFFVC